MCALWFNNCKWFRKQLPRFPEQFESDNVKSFAKYKENQLRALIGDEVYLSLTDRDRDKLFFKKVWRGRNVKHYDYRIHDMAPIVDETFKRLPKLPFKRWFNNGKIKKGVEDALVIKPSKTCRLVGITPFPLGSQPQKITYPTNLFREYLQDSAIANKYYEPYYHDTIMVNGSWGSQISDFQTLCDPVEYSVTLRDYFDAVDVHSEKLLLPKLDAPSIDSLLAVKTNQNAGTGLLSTRMFGAKHKRADTYAVRIAQSLFKRTGTQICSDISCWSVGGRGRKQKVWKDGKLRSRIILMPEAPNKILALSYAQRIYNAFGVLNWRDYRREIRIGNNDFHGNYIFYDEYMKKSADTWVEFDISTHDARTIELTMVVAFSILRSMFPPGEFIDNHFLYFMSGTIYKNVAVPGRFIYKCLKGIPSGSPFTSILVSIVNWLNCRSFIQKNKLDTDRSSIVHVFGDDTLCGFSERSVLDNEQILDKDFWIDKFRHHVGHVLDPVHIKEWGTNDADTAPQFLKTYSFHGLPARAPRDSLLSASIVRKGNASLTRYANICKGLCYSSPFDYNGLTLLEDFRSYLLLERVTRFNRIPERTVSEMRNEVNKALRITYRALTLQHLMPRVFGYEVIKNVDLGNKPSETVRTGMYNDEWVDRIIRTQIFHKESYEHTRRVDNVVPPVTHHSSFVSVIQTLFQFALLLWVYFNFKRY